MNTINVGKDSSRTEISKRKMLMHLKRELGNVRKACNTSGIGKSTFYDWCRKDAEYKKAVLNIYRMSENFAIENLMSFIGDNPGELIKIQRRNAKKIRAEK